MEQSKIILFGGTFDPIHLAHTTIASEAVKHLKADTLIFIPAKHSPLKSFFPIANDEDRLTMISLAIAGDKKFKVSDYELKKTEPSYTLNTVRYFKNFLGGQMELYWLIGADSIDDLAGWYKITDLIDECNLSVMCRAGYKAPDFAKFEAVWGPQRKVKLQKNIIKTSLIDISSTEIRKRLAAGTDVSDMACKPVANYIKEHGLYK